MQGWIKLHRKILHSELFQNEKLLKIFIYCLTKSSHKRTECRVGRQKVQLEPGQFVFGRKKASSELNMKESTVRDYLKVLQEENVITIYSTNKFSVITVNNWAVYQSSVEGTDNKTPAIEQQNDSTSPSENQQKATYNNDLELKELKNDKESIDTTTSEHSNSEVIRFYEKNFGQMPPHIHKEIVFYITDSGDEMVIEAMKRSLYRNKANWGYVKSILQSWKNKGVGTLEEAKVEESQHSHNQFRGPSSRRRSKSSSPEWLKQKESQSTQSVNKPLRLEDVATMIKLRIKYKKEPDEIIQANCFGYNLSKDDIRDIREDLKTAEEILRSKTKLKVVGDS